MADLGPLWLSVRVASVATALIVLVGVPGRVPAGAAELPGQRPRFGDLDPAAGPAADGSGLPLAASPGAANLAGRMARSRFGRDPGLSLVGSGRCVGDHRLSAVPLADPRRVRGR